MKWRKLLGFTYATLVVFSLLGLFLITGKDLAETSPNNSRYADFVGYYRSGKMVLSGDGSRIYDRELQLKYFNELSAARQSTQFIYSQNPPFFFVLLAPFALLPINLSFKLWSALSMLSLLVAFYVLMRALYGTRFPCICIFAMAALLSAPGWICLNVGQMSFFIAALATLFYFGLVFRRDILCGVALALITTKLQYVFLLSAPLLALRRFRAVAWALAAELALLVLSALIVGADNVLKYPLTLFNAETTKDYIGVFPEYMISLRGVLSLLLDRHEALVASTVIVFAGIIPLFMLWKQQSKNDSKESSAWAMAITITSALLLSAHTHIYDDVLLALAAALTLPLLWKTGRSDEISTAGGIAAGVWRATLMTFPWLSWALFIACNSCDPIKRTPFALINLALTICGYLCYLKSTKQSKTVD